jgi:hypothetical protein
VRLLHSLARTHASFDDPNLVSRAGLVPVMTLAQRAGLTELVAEQVQPGGPCGVNAPAKIGCLVARMIGGADSIDDMDLLRHGAMDALFGGIRAPSTLGSHLRSYTWGTSASWRRRACPALVLSWLAMVDGAASIGSVAPGGTAGTAGLDAPAAGPAAWQPRNG